MVDTVLAELVRDWGDFLLENVTATLYQSALCQTILYLVALFAFLRCAIDISTGSLPYRTLTFFFCWMLIMEVKGKPVFYHILNTVSLATANLFEKAMVNILTVGNTRKAMPPGFVFNSIIRASSAEISSPLTRANIRSLINSCIPDVKNNNGNPLTALDLFGGRIDRTLRSEATGESAASSSETIILNFDPKFLKNRKITTPKGEIKNCFDFLLETRRDIRANVKSQDLTKIPDQIYRSGDTIYRAETAMGSDKWETNDNLAQSVAYVAVNLAEAHALQKVVLADYFNFEEGSYLGQYAAKSGMRSPLTEIAANAFSHNSNFDPTRVVSEIANVPSVLAKSLNLSGAISSGFTLQEMNEKLVKLPYYISNMQLVLKLIAPLIIFLVLFPKVWGLVVAWSLAWFASLVVPTILIFSRSVANMIIIWTTKIDAVTTTHISDPAFLNMGVSFVAANKLMEDVGYWMDVFLEIENYMWNALFLVVPVAGGFFAQFKGNQLIQKMGQAATGSAGREVGRHTTKGVIAAAQSVKSGIAANALPYAAGGSVYAANLAGKAFSNLTRFAKGNKT